jgi:hypothetical protein
VTETEKEILTALRDLDAAVQSMATATTKPNLISLFSRIDALRSQLPKNADQNLLHYLHKQSYEKARLWLEGRDDENAAGTCRH